MGEALNSTTLPRLRPPAPPPRSPPPPPRLRSDCCHALAHLVTGCEARQVRQNLQNRNMVKLAVIAADVLESLLLGKRHHSPALQDEGSNSMGLRAREKTGRKQTTHGSRSASGFGKRQFFLSQHCSSGLFSLITLFYCCLSLRGPQGICLKTN